MEEILKQFPSSSTNNSREIVRKNLDKLRKNPSERQAQKVEALTGVAVDFSDNDWGNGERGSGFND